jgi:regulator of cell morphogenesis and NO signaling
MKETEKTIGEIVAEDYRTAKVFQKYGIDFCCGGGVTVSSACLEKGINLTLLSEEIETAKSESVEPSQNYSAWELSFLIDYIVNVHHSFIKENTGQIAGYAHKIVGVHGSNHPELAEIASLFDTISADLSSHLKEEENDFFPAVKRVDSKRKATEPPDREDIKTIKKSMDKFIEEHEAVGDAIHRIHLLAKGYEIPSDACNTYTVTYRKLQEFEDDLHKHVHLENNILFPKVLHLCPPE